MLRRIEERLDYLLEAKDYIKIKNKADLAVKETELKNKAKEARRNKIKQIENNLLEERNRKIEAREKKQLEFKIFKGRPNIYRSNKIQLQLKNDNEVKIDEEVLDQIKYLEV